MSALLRARPHGMPMLGLVSAARIGARRSLSTAAVDQQTATSGAATSSTTPEAAATTQTTAAAPTAAAPAARAPSRTAARPSLLLRVPRPPFLFLSAPLEDVSDSSWRRLVHMQGRGADLTFTEMARVENLARKSTNRTGTSWAKTAHNLEALATHKAHATLAACADDDEETARDALSLMGPLTPSVVQLLVNREDSLRSFLRSFEPTPGSFAGFQLNMGCPSPDVMKLGLGAQAVKRIAKAQKFVEILNEWLVAKCSGEEWALPSLPAGCTVPAGPGELLPMRPGVSIKLRLGANQREQVLGTHINLVRALRGDTPSGSRGASELDAGGVAGSASSAGPVAFFVLHARHGGQHYESPADLGAIARTILHSQAPNIVANGDIHTFAQVRRCVEMGAAGVMIGRAAVKDPLIFQRLKTELRETLPAVPVLAGTPVLHLPPPRPTVQSKPTFEISRFRKANRELAAEPLCTDPQLVLPPSPAALTTLYELYAREFVTPARHRSNVTQRIGKAFEPNPRPEQTATAKAKRATEREEAEARREQQEATQRQAQREAVPEPTSGVFIPHRERRERSFKPRESRDGQQHQSRSPREWRPRHESGEHAPHRSSAPRADEGNASPRDFTSSSSRDQFVARERRRQDMQQHQQFESAIPRSPLWSQRGDEQRPRSWKSDRVPRAASAATPNSGAAASPAAPTSHRDTRPGHFVPDWSGGQMSTPNGARTRQPRRDDSPPRPHSGRAGGGSYNSRAGGHA